MKKVFVLIAFLFAVVCYAAPPPDVGLIADTENEISMLQVVASDVPVFADYIFEAREVAHVDIGDSEVFTGKEVKFINECATRTEHQVLPGIYSNSNTMALNKSSGYGDKLLYAKAHIECINYLLPDRQNSNFGYPRTAN